MCDMLRLLKDRQVKLERLEDGTELDQDNGGELFEWVWRHPNVYLFVIVHA